MKWHEVEANGIDKREKSVVNERRSHSKDSRRIFLYGRVLRMTLEIFSGPVFSLPRLFAPLSVAAKRYLTINTVTLLR